MSRTRMNSRHSARPSARQSGVALFIALIFLVLLTVMALTTFTISKGSSQIVGNLTIRNQTLQTAVQTSEAAISTTRLIDQPSQVLAIGGSYGNTAAVDINSDTKTVINATVSPPTCNSAVQVASNNLNLAILRDLACANSATLHQYCFDVVFQFTTTAVDAKTSASSAVTQGAAVRAQPGPARNICHSSTGQLYF